MPADHVRRTRSVVVNVCLLAGSILFALLLSEFFLRYIINPRQVEFFQQMKLGDETSQPDVSWIEDNSAGWTMPANESFWYVSSHGEFRVKVITDEHGNRKPESAVKEANPTRKILFIGDSVTAAYEVAYDKTFRAAG